MSICPGCGVRLNSEVSELDGRANASLACRELFNALSFYTIALGDRYFIHQLAVDAYGAQHYGPLVKPIAITFALVGLYLVNERDYTGRQVQRVHMALAKRSKEWPAFTAPKGKARFTVQDVLREPDENKQEMIKRWHASVWRIWKHEQGTIAQLLRGHLDLV